MLHPASRSAKIRRTVGAVAGSGSYRRSRRPHFACFAFGCGPASTSRYPYNGRPPRNRPSSRVCARIAANARDRARNTSHFDCAPNNITNARCDGSPRSIRPCASGNHTCTPAASNTDTIDSN
ncbi:hypothetical protein GCM10027610_081770 [Dactylosporangium cerinum]